MEKFSKIKKQVTKDKEEELFKNDHTRAACAINISVIDSDGWTMVKDKDGVVCIPYLIETNQIVIRQEYVPPYKYVDGQEYHLSLVGGGIEQGETPEEALLREIQEEAGLVIRDNFKIEFMKPLFISKLSTSKCHMCILTLTENDYHEIAIKGDGTKFEDMAKVAKIDIKYLSSLNSSDIITEYMLEMFRKYVNM